MDSMSEWSARRILKEVAGPEERKAILTAFWNEADERARHSALAVLARSLHFREQSLRRAPAERKAELLAARLGSPDLEESFELALLAWHTGRERPLMAKFLDRWGVPHEQGLIEAEEYEVPSREQVTLSVAQLEPELSRTRILLYLASIGLLMGDSRPGWREATWPVVDAMLG
jgi:hypothetical protein